MVSALGCLILGFAATAQAGTPLGAHPQPAPAASNAGKLQIVAAVNGRPVTRQDLAVECLRHYGKEVLESLVNKHLIAHECTRRKINVTQAEVDTEIERMAKKFGLPVDQWLKMLKQERGINPAQYASDIIWPTLALRKLAGERLQVSREELVKTFENQYGPAVRARLIACKDLRKAEKTRAEAVARPEDFGSLAKERSEDVPSASAKGLIQPIRQHGTFQEIEQVAFSMADGEISPVIKAGGQYVILKREGLLPARDIKLEQVSSQLEELIRDKKVRSVAAEVFASLQKNAVVENVFNDPVKRQKMPGVAAMINGRQITVDELAEQCIDRHGAEVLEGTINRRLIEQAIAKQGIKITEAELDEEVARAASLSVPPKRDGTPDVAAWLELVTKKQNVTVEVYRRDAVWPSVALRKLVGGKIEISEEDLQKGYEANFGPRVRCRAIVMNNVRRAQQVWEMARANPTVEFFGELASQYSIESSSRELQGKVPPIQKHGGQPLLEKEAFAMKPGELSGVIQVGDKFIILYCEGLTKPTGVDFKSVRNDIYEDLREKKLRLAMAESFEKLQEQATIDNFLAGTSQTPRKTTTVPGANIPVLRQVPGKG